MQNTHHFIHTWLSKHQLMRWAIMLCAFVVYANSIPNKWAVDDAVVVYDNRFVKRGIKGLDSLFTQEMMVATTEVQQQAIAGGRWRPLTPMLFALGAEVLATDKIENRKQVRDKAGFIVKDVSENTNFPHILHFFNVFCYALLCGFLYEVLLLLLNPAKDKENHKANFVALVATLLYTLHPLHTEAVANVKGLDEILTLLGALRALYAFVKIHYTEKILYKGFWVMLGIVSFFLALLAKETAITFLAIIPLALFFFTKEKVKNIALYFVPLCIVAGVFLGLRQQAVSNAQLIGFKSMHLMNDPFLVLNENAQFEPLVAGSQVRKLVNTNENTLVKMPYFNQFATNIYTFGLYLKLLVLPYPLTFDYYPRHIAVKDFTDVGVIFSLLIHIFLVFWAIKGFRNKNIISFSLLFYFITFSLVSNIVFPIGTNMAERFMFMPSVGMCLAIAVLLYNFSEKWQTNYVLAGVGMVSLVFSGLIIARNPVWKDNLTLMQNDLKTSKNSAKIKADLVEVTLQKVSDELYKSGSQEFTVEQIETLQNLLPLCEEALDIFPMFGMVWFNYARINQLLAQTPQNPDKAKLAYLHTALEAYKQTQLYTPITLQKKQQEYMSLCLSDLGRFYGQKLGKLPEALAYLHEAEKQDKQNAEAYFLLATAYSIKGENEKAVHYAEKSYALRPTHIETKENLAIAYKILASEQKGRQDLLLKAEKLLLEIQKAKQGLLNSDTQKRLK